MTNLTLTKTVAITAFAPAANMAATDQFVVIRHPGQPDANVRLVTLATVGANIQAAQFGTPASNVATTFSNGATIPFTGIGALYYDDDYLYVSTGTARWGRIAFDTSAW